MANPMLVDLKDPLVVLTLILLGPKLDFPTYVPPYIYHTMCNGHPSPPVTLGKSVHDVFALSSTHNRLEWAFLPGVLLHCQANSRGRLLIKIRARSSPSILMPWEDSCTMTLSSPLR